MAIKCSYVRAPCPNDLSNLLYFLALPLPLFHTRCRRGTRGIERSGHVHMVRLAILAVIPPPSLIRFSLISSSFSTVSSVVPVERWKFIPPTLVQAAPLHFFPCITIRCKFLIIFSISLTFLALNAFLSNVEF